MRPEIWIQLLVDLEKLQNLKVISFLVSQVCATSFLRGKFSFPTVFRKII